MVRPQRLREPVRPFTTQTRACQEPTPRGMAGAGASLAKKPAHARRRSHGHKLALSVESPQGYGYGSYLYKEYLEEEAARKRQASAEA